MPDPGFGIYIHWPFCQAKCPYCDFNSHVWDKVDHAAWRDAYLKELERGAAETGGEIVRSIYFGGGTPSLMPAETVGAILDTISRRWRFENAVEITLEANPTSVEANRFKGYRAAGVNRVSLGVQALEDADLRRLGRLHSVAEALSALDIARSTFDRVSFDLIYARQDQSLSAWEAELQRALSFNPSHLSLYQLTIEPGTVFAARHAKGQLRGLPSDDAGADMWDVTQALCEGAGLPGYEISNHAKPGQESRHNQIYWNGGRYLGIGPGAHGRLELSGERIATETERSPAAWLSAVQAGQGAETRQVLSGEERAEERLMMGLRTLEGVPLPEISSVIDPVALADLVELSLISVDSEHVMVTPQGRPLLNAILGKLLRTD